MSDILRKVLLVNSGRRLCTLGVILVFAMGSVPSDGSGRTWHVPGDFSTIQGGIDAASSGDDVLVGPGEYSEFGIRLKSGIVVHSEEGASVTRVDAHGSGSVFVGLDLGEMCAVQGFTILGGLAAGTGDDGCGGGLRCRSSSLAIRECVIRDCQAEWKGGGLCAFDSEVTVDDCVIRECGAGVYGGGICVGASVEAGGSVEVRDSAITDNHAGGSGGGMDAVAAQVVVERCVVARNAAAWGGGAGIACIGWNVLLVKDSVVSCNTSYENGEGTGLLISSSVGGIKNCSLIGNIGFPHAGACVQLDASDIDIENTIVAFSEGYAVRCWWPSRVTMRCCDLFGNTEGNELCGEDLGGNINADPLLCDQENSDYTLDAPSPCLPGNHPDGVDCGLIGALGQGCGAIPTGACCFPDGACTVLTRSQCTDQEGTYQGDGSVCEPNPCQPTAVEGTTWGRIRASFR
jgi:hypothetical protein